MNTKTLFFSIVLVILAGCASVEFQGFTQEAIKCDAKPKISNLKKGRVESTWTATCGEDVYDCKRVFVTNYKTKTVCSNFSPKK